MRAPVGPPILRARPCETRSERPLPLLHRGAPPPRRTKNDMPMPILLRPGLSRTSRTVPQPPGPPRASIPPRRAGIPFERKGLLIRELLRRGGGRAARLHLRDVRAGAKELRRGNWQESEPSWCPRPPRMRSGQEHPPGPSERRRVCISCRSCLSMPVCSTSVGPFLKTDSRSSFHPVGRRERDGGGWTVGQRGLLSRRNPHRRHSALGYLTSMNSKTYTPNPNPRPRSHKTLSTEWVQAQLVGLPVVGLPGFEPGTS